jgi:hypothetical protein
MTLPVRSPERAVWGGNQSGREQEGRQEEFRRERRGKSPPEEAVWTAFDLKMA